MYNEEAVNHILQTSNFEVDLHELPYDEHDTSFCYSVK